MCLHYFIFYRNSLGLQCLLKYILGFVSCQMIIEPRHDKSNKMSVRPAKTQISLGIRPVWSESSLSAWRKLGSLATHWAHSEDSFQTGRMPRLIWVFAGRTATLLVLSCRGSYYLFYSKVIIPLFCLVQHWTPLLHLEIVSIVSVREAIHCKWDVSRPTIKNWN